MQVLYISEFGGRCFIMGCSIMVKKEITIVLIVIALFTGLVLGFVVSNNMNDNQNEEQNYTHVTINGTILAYKKPEEGLYFIIDDDATPSYKEVIVTEDTLFTDELLKEQINSREEGIYVTVEVDAWTDDLYTAALISQGPSN